MKLKREERVAFARIISDLIEADFIIEEEEMDIFDKIKSEKDFNITMSMLSEAKTKTFAEAVNTLQSIENEEKALILKKLYEMSMSDGNCAELEALQIIAVKCALEGNGEVFSIPYSNSIENKTVLYVEREDNTDIDSYINSHYRVLSNEFRLAGFNFVYIPRIAEDYKQIKKEYLHKVIKYMIPTLETRKVDEIQNALCSMTTSRFTHEFLYKKMGINILASEPAFLFKIGESSVVNKNSMIDMEYNIYSNFLLVRINKIRDLTNVNTLRTILNYIAELMDSYRSIVSGKLIVENLPLTKKFRHYSFHRSLFNLIAFEKERANYKLVINFEDRTRSVVFRPIEEIDSDKDLVVSLSPQPTTLYILMIFMSLLGENLDWTDPDNLNDETKKRILEKYNVIYDVISKGNYSICYRDKSHVSRIKKALNVYGGIISNIDLFIPDKILSGGKYFYNVPTPPDLVYLIEGAKGNEREIKVIDSEFWKSNFK